MKSRIIEISQRLGLAMNRRSTLSVGMVNWARQYSQSRFEQDDVGGVLGYIYPAG